MVASMSKRYFGNPAAKTGKQLTVSAWIPGAPNAGDAWIVKQDRRRGMFTVTDGQHTGRVFLVPGGAPLKEGQARIQATVFGSGNKEHVRAFSGRKLRTFEGNVYQWSKNGASASGQVDLPLS